MAVTATEAEMVLAARKTIDVSLSWSGRQDFYKLQADVLLEDTDEILDLRGNVGRTNRSFALLYRNTPIRKYTVHNVHRDPATNIVHREPHKHFWDDVWGDRRVYIPTDIRIGNPNEELMDFLGECNIRLSGSYRPLTLRRIRGMPL